MAEYQINRARLVVAPMAIPFTTSNEQSQILLSGVIASTPVVALAYSYAVVDFDGNALHAGNKITVGVGSNEVMVTLDEWGNAQVSLLPFIREEILKGGALDNPLYCATGAEFQQNGYRGYIDVDITEDGQSPITMRVYYIFGNYAPKGEAVTDLYFDFDANGETWCNVDDASNYDAAGLPVSFEDNWCNINELVEDTPVGDFLMQLDVAYYYGKDDIQFSTINYHFRYDCRTDNVLKLRWLDQNGNINTRKFTLAGRSHGASASSTWQRPHPYKEINLGYDRGKDEWAELTASETITIGDDCIPMTHYNWLKTLASSAVVEAYINGAWTRCNVTNTTIECDPRKPVFSTTVSLLVPTDDVQQF